MKKIDRKITILVFDAPFDGVVTLDCPEIRQSFEQVASAVVKHIVENKELVIRSYVDVPINIIGSMIELGPLKHEDITIIKPDGGIVRYTEDGVLDRNWEHGLMSHYGDDHRNFPYADAV